MGSLLVCIGSVRKSGGERGNSNKQTQTTQKRQFMAEEKKKQLVQEATKQGDTKEVKKVVEQGSNMDGQDRVSCGERKEARK